MGTLETSLYSLRHVDELSSQRTFIHQLDPRVKLITTFFFIVVVVSFNRYEITGLFPFIFFPLFVAAGGNLPLKYFLKRLLHLSPFVLFVGIFNPIFDHSVVLKIGRIGITGGWISFAGILIRYCLTVSALLLLVASTGFNPLCHALERLRIPGVFILQLMFVYRYIFVLVEESIRMIRAYNLRSFKRRAPAIRIFIPIIGTLLIRTLERAQSIHRGMLSRGFDGRIRLQRRLKFRSIDYVYLISWATVFIMLRFFNVSSLLGRVIIGVLQ
ncbi:MAG: cobalt ECF transporter T component CbiQ [Spirochaetota bacterium]